jgi:hypothetical protein
MEFKILKKLHEHKLKLDGVIYKPYMIGNLPPTFGFILNTNASEDQTGINQWFNYKGLTYIKQ